MVGHELIHKKEWMNKLFGTWAYTKFFYSHFLDEHILGHHKSVGTPEDPATAHKGESIYQFVLRSFIFSHYNSFKREIKRLRKKWGNDCSIIILISFNKMTLYLIIHAVLLIIIYILLELYKLFVLKIKIN